MNDFRKKEGDLGIVKQWFSKYGPWTSSISIITWEFLQTAKFGPSLPISTKPETLAECEHALWVTLMQAQV